MENSFNWGAGVLVGAAVAGTLTAAAVNMQDAVLYGDPWNQEYVALASAPSSGPTLTMFGVTPAVSVVINRPDPFIKTVYPSS